MTPGRSQDPSAVVGARLLLLHGPNLNLLGQREPEVYGTATLADIEALTARAATRYDMDVRCVQSNHEGDLVDAIHGAAADCVGVVVNPGAYAHTSIALRDAITSVGLPVAEVHLSNVFAREPFRQHSYVSQVAQVVICGAREDGYELAVTALARLLARS